VRFHEVRKDSEEIENFYQCFSFRCQQYIFTYSLSLFTKVVSHDCELITYNSFTAISNPRYASIEIHTLFLSHLDF
jgi:hypothetical protein